MPAIVVANIQRATRAEMSRLNLASGQIHFLQHPQQILGQYFKSAGIAAPHIFSCILFHRPGNFQQALHIDCNNDDPPKQMLAAINIPIDNCEDSYMEWYRGDYATVEVAHVGADGKTRKFLDLKWQGEPELLDKTIIDQPTLVRVNVPHRVSVIDRTRSLITFRFVGNPEFDHIADIFASI